MNDGASSLVTPVGPLVIVVSGAAVSTVNARVAGDASVLPAASVARTRERVRPVRERPEAFGELQVVNVPVAAPGPSSLHSNVESISVDVNENDCAATFVVPIGPAVIVVSGAAVSTVNVRVAATVVGVAGRVGRADRERVAAVGVPSDFATAIHWKLPVAAPGPSSRTRTRRRTNASSITPRVALTASSSRA